MSKAPQTFCVNAGETVHIPITVVDNAGAAVDLTASVQRFALSRKRVSSVVVGTELSPPNATADPTDLANGLFTIQIADTVTAALLGTYYWESEVEDSTGNKVTVARGWATFGSSIV